LTPRPPEDKRAPVVEVVLSVVLAVFIATVRSGKNAKMPKRCLILPRLVYKNYTI
jgi:hypothetical protein